MTADSASPSAAAPAGSVATPAAPAPGDLLDVRGLRVVATRGAGAHAVVLDGVDLRVAPGECVGVVGESGSGKSLAVRAVVGLLPEGTAVDGGSVRLSGREVLDLPPAARHAVRGRQVALLLQDPFTMLHPQLTCGAQIADGLRAELPALAAARGRRARRTAERREIARRLAEVGLRPEVADRYPHELSGGMRQRVAVAAALAGDPELLVADEPTTALDAANQGAVLDLLRSLQRGRGMGLVLITHDLRVAFSACDRVYVLYAGAVLEEGRAAELEADPRHPYTAGLLASEPSVRERFERLPTIPGSVPPPGRRGAGCPFADRCPHAAPVCGSTTVRLRPVAAAPRGGEPGTRLSACLRLAEIDGPLTPERVTGDAPPRAAEAPAPAGSARADDTDTTAGTNSTAGANITAGAESGSGAGDAPAGVPALRVDSVSRTFRSDAGDHVAVRGVSLTVAAGRVTALVGESGSGKTTLARVAIGLETFDAGRVDVAGLPLAPGRRPTVAERARLARRAQIVFQDPYASLNPLRTVSATLREALTAAGQDTRVGRRERAERDRRRVDELLTQVGLPTRYAARRPAGLSGGERQRVALARALAVRPRLLICDEAVAALDVSVQAQLLNLLARLQRAEGFAVLFITHDLGVVRQIADEVAVMYEGEIVERGRTADVLDRPAHAWTRRMLAALPSSTSHGRDPSGSEPLD
ncbi:dipeptide ABC transporter ATP-binding protein [Streptomyces sp. NPDC008150]|uniref:dipeptide ABC transporter ATP-binding protein n=1 Tax=Streptomyces sp. NPDC008150 TaxID=3364816 RepID=UPI0036E03422